MLCKGTFTIKYLLFSIMTFQIYLDTASCYAQLLNKIAQLSTLITCLWLCLARKGQTETHTHTCLLVLLIHHWQTEVSLSLPLTNTYNQHLRSSHLHTYDKNTEHSFSGCLGDTNYRVQEGSWDDAGERRSGTPCDEQGLSLYSHTHTTPWSVCVCVCVYEQLAQIPQGHVCMPALL